MREPPAVHFGLEGAAVPGEGFGQLDPGRLPQQGRLVRAEPVTVEAPAAVARPPGRGDLGVGDCPLVVVEAPLELVDLQVQIPGDVAQGAFPGRRVPVEHGPVGKRPCSGRRLGRLRKRRGQGQVSRRLSHGLVVRPVAGPQPVGMRDHVAAVLPAGLRGDPLPELRRALDGLGQQPDGPVVFRPREHAAVAAGQGIRQEAESGRIPVLARPRHPDQGRQLAVGGLGEVGSAGQRPALAQRDQVRPALEPRRVTRIRHASPDRDRQVDVTAPHRFLEQRPVAFVDGGFGSHG